MFRRMVLLALGALALGCFSGGPMLAQQQTEPRIAFVVGNAGYGAGALPTALNDAGLVAEALRSIGFEIVEGADLSQTDLVRTYRDFLAKVEASGPDTLAFVYFSGHALAFDGENFLLGVDARLERDSDIPIESVRLSDLLRPLAASPARAKVMMIDAARPLPFRPQGRVLARGLEAIEAPQGMLMAYSSAPGTVAPDQPGDYGAYATAIAEMLRAPGTDLDTAFTHIRSRTHLTTQGQQTPWHVSALGESIELVPPEAATASVPLPPPIRQTRPMREIGPDEAYALAIEMDTLEGYSGFVQAYPGHPYTQRVWAMIRARREALAWMRALEFNTPQSYWTYLRRYPNGMYAFDAERRLRRLGSPFAPPPDFAMMEFDDVPMALVDEPREYVEVYRVGPPPPRGLYGAPRPAYLANLPPPQRRGGGGAGSRILPALAVGIPLMAALAPAPRRALPPDARGRRDGFGPRGGNPNRGAPAPASLGPNRGAAPNTAIAPSTVTPSPGAALPSPGGNRPPGWGPGPGGQRPPGASGRPPAGAPPNNAAVAPSAVAPNPAAPPAPGSATPSPGGPPPPAAGRPPGRLPRGGPPPGIANRTPPGAPPAPGVAAPGAAIPNAVAPPPRQQPPAGAGRPPGRPPGAGPPPGIANRTPPAGPPPQSAAPPVRPQGPPPQANRPPPQMSPPPRPPGPPPQMNRPPPQPAPAVIARPTPPAAPVARPAPPPPRPAAPPPAAAAAARPPAPPPPRPAAPPPARPPACPPGKSFVNGACR
jgi:hypothetical protein